MPPKRIPPEQRFWSFVDKGEPDECWEWKGNAHPTGYGKFWEGDRTVYAHRFSYALAHGLTADLPLDIRHSCDNPRCVNPAHLSLGTAQDNANDRVSRGRSLKGERHNLAKLTAEQVKFIRNSNMSNLRLRMMFGVAKSTISAVKNGQNWKHLPEDD